jgi:excisionase family DNA binding protein
METLSFEVKNKKPIWDNLPQQVAEMSAKLDRLLEARNLKPDEPKDALMTLEELMEYLPEKPKRPTVYGWVNDRKIPFLKFGKRLYFRKSDIDNWTSNGRQI